MFSVLNVVQPKKSLFGRRKCTVEMLLSPVRGGAPYKVINVTAGKKGIDWKKVAQAAGASGRFMLVPDGVQIPLTVGIEKFVPCVLPALILLNTIASSASASGKLNRSILIADREGLLAAYVECVVPCASKITVVTDEPEKYFDASIKIMDEYGASIRVCGGVSENEKFDIAVSDEEIDGVTLRLAPCEVCQMIDDNVLHDYLHLCVDGIDPFLFVCALFECSGLKEPGELTLNNG